MNFITILFDIQCYDFVSRAPSRYHNFSLVILRVNMSLHLEGDTVPMRWCFYFFLYLQFPSFQLLKNPDREKPKEKDRVKESERTSKSGREKESRDYGGRDKDRKDYSTNKDRLTSKDKEKDNKSTTKDMKDRTRWGERKDKTRSV